jgi:3-hydroxyacyl-CoA dehydrogenase/3a,7a,12a-trihydroxy-5b-cholest-24-enoyl-CoA hydratase
MSDLLRYDGRVAIVTGAGNGLGRSHALLLASRGAKVVVNDLGGSFQGSGASSSAADKVVAEIKEKGGEAVANYDSVENGDKIVKTAIDAFGKIDIVVNNAGILRDTSFRKMTEQDWDLIYKVHMLGAFRVTYAAWPHMLDAGYGRIIFTSSAAGIYGNFGQANYSAMKIGLIGFGQTLAAEGRKKNVRVNVIAPIAGSRMTETVLPKELLDALKPEYVSPLVAYLVHESCEETGGIFEVGGGVMNKLRWERTVGKTFKLGREITPDAVKAAWGQITDFEKSTHPANITESMQPVMDNLASKSKGGNEFIDVDAALGFEFPEMKSKYDERDLAIYALGVGAAQDPLDTEELQYVYEMNPNGFHAIPTFGVIPAIGTVLQMAKEGKQAPGMNYGFERILHGEQYTEIKRPLPPSAKLTHKSRIKDIWDKGKNAVVVTETRSYDENGNELIYNEMSAVVRGAGGWGGERGPATEANAAPDRKPDAVIEEKTNQNQALLYRLTGDWNPLHADPQFAQGFGFPKPILHGLCTFGFAGRAVIKAFSKNDPRYFKSIKVRFAEPVFPGETIVTEMWKENDQRILFRCKVKERDKVVISNAVVELYKEIPKETAKPTTTPSAAAPAASNEPTSADIFNGIGAYLAKHPELVKSVGTVFAFKLSNPNSAWTIDLKNGNGAVKSGADGAECTLEISDADFMGMATGKLDAQKLYFGGKLKISGNVMASQKLTFMQKIEPQYVIDAMKARVGSSGGAVTPSAAPAAPAAVTSGDVFYAIGEHIAKHPELVGQIGTTFLFKLTNPSSAYLIDLKNGKGSVAPGEAAADVTLTLDDSDWLAMSEGKADPQKLYFGGKLKIGGNVMASQKLTTLMKGMDPAAAKEAIAKRKASGASAAPPTAAVSSAPAAASANAGAIFKALGDRIAKTPGLVKEVAAVIQFDVTDPTASFTVDLKNGTGGVKEGAGESVDTRIKIADEDLTTIAKGGDVRDLYQHGKIRVDGLIRPAHSLGFLKGLA